jgi:hypothetical protein
MNDQELEHELRLALRRIEPERDFSAIVYTRRRVSYWPPSRTMLALAAALLIMLLIPAGVIRYREQQRRSEEARAQLITALRITGNKLHRTRQMVVRGLNRRNSL